MLETIQGRCIEDYSQVWSVITRLLVMARIISIGTDYKHFTYWQTVSMPLRGSITKIIINFLFRKTCKNCKCSRDGHEVVAEHGARSRLGFVGHDGLDARTLGYTFVPPGLTTARQVYNKTIYIFNLYLQ